MVDSVYVSTDFVEAEERNDFWREVTRPVFETLPCSDAADRSLRGSIRSRVVGSLLIGNATFNRQCYCRDPGLSAHREFDHYLLQVFTAGTLRGDFNGTNVCVNTGDICITDLSQALKSEVEAGSTISIALPRQFFDAIGPRNLHGTVLQRRMPMTSLLVGYLQSLCSLTAELPATQETAVEDATFSLLSAALGNIKSVVTAEDVVSSANLRQRICHFVMQNICMPELSPDFLCRQFNVSRAHLYRAFANDGGVAKVLRDMRLDSAYLELNRPVGAVRTITAIAFSLCFSSGNQFLRSFRKRFGMTPSEVRTGERTINHSRAIEPRQQNDKLLAHFARLSKRATQERSVATVTSVLC